MCSGSVAMTTAVATMRAKISSGPNMPPSDRPAPRGCSVNAILHLESEAERRRGPPRPAPAAQGGGCDELVPAGEVVELGDLVEPELHVHGRHGELGGIDHAALKGRKNVGRRE